MHDAVIDIGNTRVKVALFDQSGIAQQWTLPTVDIAMGLVPSLVPYRLGRAIVSNVGARTTEWLTALQEFVSVHVLSYRSRLPFETRYTTPQTLGLDRIAAVAAVAIDYPDRNCLVIDAGTCITYDILTKDRIHLGGNIAPGADMRLRAMHDYTAALPRVKRQRNVADYGYSTDSALLAGAWGGALAEIEGFIARYEAQLGTLDVVMTGGDAAYFAPHLKKRIFARPDLVLHGLYQILLLQ